MLRGWARDRHNHRAALSSAALRGQASRKAKTSNISIVVAAAVSALFTTLAGCATVRTPTVREPGSTTSLLPGAIAGPDLRGPLQANAVVTYISDGDTIVVRVDEGAVPEALADSRKPNGEVSLRLIGIDTPESKKPNTPVECFAKESAAALSLLLPEGTPVMVELDVESRDRYDRVLGYIYRASDGLFVNHEMARTGMATSLVIKPNTRHTDQLREAADAAEANRIGLWSACDGAHEPTR